MAQDWTKMSAADLGRGIGAGEIDPVSLTETFLSAIESHEAAGRIYARTTPDRARAEAGAAAARAEAGRRLSPLDGVPISWKDLFDTVGTATEAGSALLKGRTPERDAEVLRNATAAGLVCLGKTHMTELAFSGLGLNPVTATPPNVNDPEAVPGGSSSGAAASVAFGLAAAGIGSDTAGSVRVPSVWNDLVGLKPGHGATSLEGVVPLCPSLDSVGPLCRTVEDASLLMAALTGGKAPDLRGASLKGTRFMVLDTVALDDLEEAPKQGFERAVERLEAAGATVERRAVPEVAQALDLAAVVFATEGYGVWKDAIEGNPDVMYHQIRERFRGGRDTLGSDFVAAWQRLHALRQAYREATAGFDAVILPTSPILPPNAERLAEDDAYYAERNLMTLRNTRIGSLLNLAGLTLPTGVPSTGILFQAPAGAENCLLRLGVAAERALA